MVWLFENLWFRLITQHPMFVEMLLILQGQTDETLVLEDLSHPCFYLWLRSAQVQLRKQVAQFVHAVGA